jgi:hypothetical protein
VGVSMPEPLRELGQGIPDRSGKFRIAQLCAALAVLLLDRVRADLFPLPTPLRRAV